MNLPMNQYSLAEVNQLSQTEFVAVLGAIFEGTPEITAQVWQSRPFGSVEELHQAMVNLVRSRDRATNLKLLQVHPDLGSKAKMASASVQEQTSVGLDALSETECERFHKLNQIYRECFGFPFIIAVRNHTKDSILKAFEMRLQNSLDQEYETALSEVMKIAWHRLISMIAA